MIVWDVLLKQDDIFTAGRHWPRIAACIGDGDHLLWPLGILHHSCDQQQNGQQRENPLDVFLLRVVSLPPLSTGT